MIGAIISDVFWGKFRTIMVFSIVYAIGCVLLALFGSTTAALAVSLFLVALGTGGIKPCVSTNVGDQFTAKNQHLIERAFSLLLPRDQRRLVDLHLLVPGAAQRSELGSASWAFGLPAAMMMLATLVFCAGRKRYAHVPPAGKAWLKDIFSKEGVKLIANLVVIYFFVAIFWMLWDQSNGNTWTLQAAVLAHGQEPRLRHHAAARAAAGGERPVHPRAGADLHLRHLPAARASSSRSRRCARSASGLFTVAASFLIVAWIEKRIQGGHMVSAWWQILAYVVLTASEMLVSITALEFSYKQAPLRMKSFIMALFLLSTSLGNLGIAAVNKRDGEAVARADAWRPATQTWVTRRTRRVISSPARRSTSPARPGSPVIDADGKPGQARRAPSSWRRSTPRATACA